MELSFWGVGTFSAAQKYPPPKKEILNDMIKHASKFSQLIGVFNHNAFCRVALKHDKDRKTQGATVVQNM